MAYRSDGHAAHALAQGMGWVSIGLGLAELLAPGNLARFLGMEERTELIRVYGMREIATGVGILSQDDPTPWMWGRVGGDMLDLGTPAAGLRRSNPQRENVGLAIAAVAGVTLLDVFCAQALSRKPGESRNADSRLQRAARHAAPAGCDARDRTRLPRPARHAYSGGDAPVPKLSASAAKAAGRDPRTVSPRLRQRAASERGGRS